MASVISESFVARASYLSDEKERQIDKLQRQFCELKKQCDKYFDDLDEKICEVNNHLPLVKEKESI